jgi:hypothetical protein
MGAAFLGLAALLLVGGAGGFALSTRLVMILLLGGAAAGIAGFLVSVRNGVRKDMALAGVLQEAVSLRQWPAAVAAADLLLSRPVREPGARAQSLILLVMVLSRHHKFDEADALADQVVREIAGPPVAMLRAAQALMRLRTGRLLDADTALRGARRELAEMGEHAPPETRAATTLAEMYRDVLTNHHDEAEATFQQMQTAAGDALGERSADFHALGALTAEALGLADEATRRWRDATLLVPAVELRRRYPELRAVAEAHPAAQLWQDAEAVDS